MTLNWLLILVIVILIWNLISGYRKGFVRILYRCLSSLLAFLLSVILVMTAGDAIRDATPVYAALENWTEKYITSASTGNTLVDLVLSEAVLGEELARSAAQAIFNILLFLVLFVILKAVISLLHRVLEHIMGWPVLSLLNRVAGAGAGLINGLIVVWLLMIFLELIGGTALGDSAADCISEQVILQKLSDQNILWSIAAAFLI